MSLVRFFGRPWVARLCFILALISYIGLPQFFWQITCESMKEEQRLSPEEEIKASNEYRSFVKAKLVAAKKKIAGGGIYSPKDYFQDLKDMDEKGKRIRYFGVGYNTDQGELREMIRSKLVSGDAGKQYEKELETAREDYKRFIDPARESREKTYAHIWQMGVFGIAQYFLLFYLKLLPFALLLLTSWINKRRQEENEFIGPKPIRFLLALLLYPVTICYVLFKWLEKKEQYYLAEAEMRRTKQNLFGSLSEKEIRHLKEFRDNSLTLPAWRKSLASLGLKPRHTFATALAVTLLLALVPVLAQAETKTKAKEILPEVVLEQVIQNHSARMDVDGEGSYFQLQKSSDSQNQEIQEGVFEPTNFELRLIVRFFLLHRKILRLKEICRQIFHVPLFSYSVQGRVFEIKPITE